MSYCTITEVRAQNPKRTYDGTSKPTLTEVETFITNIGNEIDSILAARGLTVPITAPASFLGALVQLNAFGAAALAEMAMFPGELGPGATPHGRQLWSMYREGLVRLEKGELPTSLESGGGPQSFFTEHGDESEAPSEDRSWAGPKFGKDKVF